MPTTVTSFECPKCGAPVNYGSARCDFCQCGLVTIDNGAAVLPIGIAPETVDGLWMTNEDEFWSNTSSAMAGGAPYAIYDKICAGFDASNWAEIIRANGVTVALDLVMERTVLLKGECLVVACSLETPGVPEFAVATNYRLVIIRVSSILMIPWTQFISWREEMYGNGVGDKNNRLGRPVLRWMDGVGEKKIAFDSLSKYMESLSAVVCQAGDSSQLNPLQKQLLSASRWGLKRGAGLDLPPITRSQIQPPQPAALTVAPKCFPAGTAILTPVGSCPIESVRVGDVVMSVQPNKTRIPVRVRSIASHAWGEVVEVEVHGMAHPLRATAGHLVFGERGWTPVRDLRPGDEIRLCAERDAFVGSVRSVRPIGRAPVYSIYVTGPQVFVADGVVCHNYTFAIGLRTLVARVLLDPWFEMWHPLGLGRNISSPGQSISNGTAVGVG